MNIWMQIAIYYGVGAVIVGGFVSAMDEVNFSFRDRPFPYPRVAAGIVSGVIWPAVIWKMVMPRRGHQ